MTLNATLKKLLDDQAAELESILAIFPDAIVLSDEDSRIVHVNANFASLFGYTADEVVGKRISHILGSEESYESLRQARVNIAGSEDHLSQAAFRRKDGASFVAETTYKPVKDANGSVIGFVDLIRDVSHLRADESKLHQLVQSAPIGIVVSDEDGRIELANPEAEKLFGYSHEELLGRPVELLLPESYHQKHIAHRAKYVKDPYFRRMGIGLNLLALTKEGREFPAEISLNLMKVGGKTFVISFVADVTRQKRVEDALRESEELLRSTILSMDDLVVILDREACFVHSELPTEKYRYLLGEEPQGRPFADVLPDRAAQQLASAFDALRNGGDVQQFEFATDLGSGKRWFDAKASARTDKEGKFDGITLVARDVTRRKAAEIQLTEHAAELEARNAELDAFAHTVAHDLKTPIALIVGFAELLLQSPFIKPAGEDLETLNQIMVMGHRLNNTVNELLLLSTVRRTDVEMEPLDMKSIVEDAQAKVSHLSDNHQATLIIPYSWPVALGHGPWIEEVWVNYLSNAMKYGGLPPRIELGATPQPDGMIRFWIKDNGEGISLEEQEKVFAPFTQLSQVRAKGHGLGLSIVRRIIEKCNGTVGVDSQTGNGATFWFTLPAAAE